MMGLIALLCQMVVAGLFLTTAVDKVWHWKRHVQQISAYELTPDSWSKVLLIVFFTAEALVSISFIFHGIHLYNVSASIVLLGVYTVAVSINLLRGRRHISCGCGGVLENDTLHAGIVLRNGLLMLTIFGLYMVKATATLDVTALERVSSMFLAAGVLLLAGIAQQVNRTIRTIRRLANKLF